MDVTSMGMDPNGFDTVLFTANKSLELIRSVTKSVGMRWDDYIIDVDADDNMMRSSLSAVDHRLFTGVELATHTIVTLLKDEQMESFFNKRSYELMANGEGAISYHFRHRQKIMFRLGELTEVRRGEGEKLAVAPYNAWLCSGTILELTVVTPANPASDPFSKWAVQLLIDACLG